MNHVEIEGVRLETEHIPGPANRSPLVFLHEGLGSVGMWRSRGCDWPRDLCAATGRAGWLYSRRGYGASDPVEDVRGTPRWQDAWHIGRHEPDYMHLEARWVLPRLLSHWQVERPVLIGHSDGATIALLHAIEHPVAACVAIAPHTWVEDIALRSISAARDLYLNPPDATKSLRQRLARYHANVDNAFWQWNDVWLSPAFRDFDIRQECTQIRSPVLAIQGREDEYGTSEQLTTIGRLVPRAHVTDLANCGHSPHRDQPTELTDRLVRFLAHLP